MKIAKIETAEIQIPLRTPFKTALRTVDSVHDLLVRVTADDGSVGYGEAPPTAVITGDTLGSLKCAIEEFIAPALVGREVEDLDGTMTALERCMVKNTSAKAAVDMAVFDLFAQSCGKPLYQVLGGAKRQIETDLTISVNPTPEMVRDAQEAVARGFRILKIKVGKDGLSDIQRLKAIRQAVGPLITIRVDANQGWEAKQAVRIITGMEDAGVDAELIEQPVPAHDVDGLAYITSRVSTPILADEAVFSPADALSILQRHAADYLNIKLMKTGGIWQALKICNAAEVYGAKCMVGCMLESKLAVSAAAHLAAARGVVTMVDLDGPSLCSTDPYTGGPLYNEGTILMNETPGIGITGVPGFEVAQ